MQVVDVMLEDKKHKFCNFYFLNRITFIKLDRYYSKSKNFFFKNFSKKNYYKNLSTAAAKHQQVYHQLIVAHLNG